MFGLNVVQRRGDEVARESVYVFDGLEAGRWRIPWATRFDPLASVSPPDWREGQRFGIQSASETRPGTAARSVNEPSAA